MSLQSAPLGQLPSMSMPYSIPRYEKPQGVLQKALTALLVNAAGTAATQGTQNLLSTDHAAEFGQDPRSGFGRLLNPVVNDREAEQRRSLAFTGAEGQRTREFQQSELDQRLTAEAAQREADARNAQLFEGVRQQGGLDERELADRNAQLRLDRQLAGEQVNTRLKASLEGTDPESVARTGLYKAQGGKYNSDAAFQNHMLEMLSRSGKPAPGTPAAGVTEADRAAMHAVRQGQGQPSIANPASDYVAGPADIAQYLAQGVSPEEIAARIGRQQAVNARAQARPLPDTTPIVDPRLAALIQQLGLNPPVDSSVYNTLDMYN